MKTRHLPFHFYSLTVLILITSLLNCMGQPEPDQLLDRYLETGSMEHAEKIRDGYPGSVHEKTCDAWEYMGGNDEIAQELAEQLVNDHPDFARAHFVRGTVLLQGFQDYRGAINALDRSIEIDPSYMPSYLNRGIARIGIKEYESAKEDIEKVLEMKRGFAQGFLLRGVVNYELGQEEAMKADFEIGLQLDYKALAQIPGDFADKAIDKAIETAPDNAIFYYARGYARYLDGNYRSALSDFSTCIEIAPGSSDFYKYSGACRMHLNDYVGSQKELNYALSVNPDDPEIYYFLGSLNNDYLKQPAMAREYMNHAINLVDNVELYYFERSKAAYRMMNYQEARDDINKALLLDPTRGDFYAMRGNIKMKTGRPAEDYCPDFTKAVERGTSYNLKRILKRSCR
jgi:tetratricopeptide (TPR) repeat protein